MKLFTHIIFRITILMIVVLLPGFVLAADQSRNEQVTSAETESIIKEPDMADIIPLSGQLAGRLAVLRNQIAELPDTTAIEKQYEEIGPDMKRVSEQIETLKESKEYRLNKIEELKDLIKKNNELITEIGKPLRHSIQLLGKWRKDWLKEKKQWNQWQTIMNTDNVPDQLKTGFEKANITIDTAIKLIISKLGEMMSVQEKSTSIESKLPEFSTELDVMITGRKRGAIHNASPPMFSSEYFSQFNGGLWFATKNIMNNIVMPGSGFSDRQGWVIFIQVIFSFFVGIIFYRNKQLLNTSENWIFLGSRPFTAGIFLVSVTAMLIYEYHSIPALWKVLNNIVAGISFIFLSEDLIKIAWRRQCVFGLIMFLIITHLLYVINFPLPIFRLCTSLASLAGIAFCLRWANESAGNKEPAVYFSLLRLGAFFFGIIFLAELFGIVALPLYLFISLIDSIATALVFMIFLHMIHGGVEWLIRNSPLTKTEVLLNDEIEAIIGRVTRLINFAIWFLVFFPAVLMIWGLYDNLPEATNALFSLGFSIRDHRISFGLVMVSAGILYISYFLSWIIQKLLMNIVLVKKVAEQGVRFSITRLIHYFIIFIGFLIAISSLGLDVTKLTIIISALGVGIGFGLQGIVNNFISGLILLFERPVRVGDIIEIAGKWAEIKRIGLRATTVQTFEQADVIIPNADLIANNVTNWTLDNRQVRATMPVGVAYGSDVSLVMKTLIACAANNPKVAQRTVPQILFMGFGSSSLDFELRVWVIDADYRLQVVSELNQEIDRRFREANIEIAFPQRDLHLRSVDESIHLQHMEATI